MLRLRRKHTVNYPLQLLEKDKAEQIENGEEIQRVLTTKTTLNDLIYKAQSIEDKCSDFVTSGDVLKMEVGCDGKESNPKPNLVFSAYDNEVLSTYKGKLTDFSLGQLCTKVGVPTSYVNRCIRSGEYGLSMDNVNTWLSKEKQNPLLVRMYGDKIRGLLSSRYQRFDTSKILSMLNSAFSSYAIKGYYLDEERFHLRAVLPRKLNVEGEDLYAGLQVDSSDVGRSSLTIMFFVFKQVCTNGLCVSHGGGVLFSQKHIGIEQSEFNGAVVSAFDKIPDLAKSIEGVIQASRETPILRSGKSEEQFITDMVKSIHDSTKMSETDAKKVVEVMQNKYGETNWGLINSITEVAQEFTLERRIELEKIAGNMLFARKLIA